LQIRYTTGYVSHRVRSEFTSSARAGRFGRGYGEMRPKRFHSLRIRSNRHQLPFFMPVPLPRGPLGIYLGFVVGACCFGGAVVVAGKFCL